MRCQIRIQGHLAPSWRAWFEGLELTQEDEGATCLSGLLPDQAALHGILAKIRSLGLNLLSLSTSETALAEEPDKPP
jgi:hypothetical protein